MVRAADAPDFPHSTALTPKLCATLATSALSLGPCNDIFAPGSDITGAYSGKNYPTNEYITGSGTSMATPHVAGLMAAHLSVEQIDAAALKAKLLNDAEVDSIDLACGGNSDCLQTPNALLHLEC